MRKSPLSPNAQIWRRYLRRNTHLTFVMFIFFIGISLFYIIGSTIFTKRQHEYIRQARSEKEDRKISYADQIQEVPANSLQSINVMDKRDISEEPVTLFPLQNTNQLQYGIVIDCGSSGTRLFAYSWKRRHGFEDVTADQVPERTGNKYVIKKLEPGISTLTPEEALGQIEELLTYASQHLPQDSHSDTILYILATAGLRMISIEQRTKLLRTIRREIPRKFVFDLREVSVISGQDEGLFAWLSINSIMNRLCDSEKNPVAIMDMGGGSIQVAIPLLDDAETEAKKNFQISTADIQTIDLSCGKRHKIFIHTWLGYGANKARERYENFILKNSKNKTSNVADPCLPKNVELGKYTGDGNFSKCRELIAGKNVFKKSSETSDQPNLLSCLDENSDIACTYPLNPSEQLPKMDLSKLELVGISEFYYTTEDTFKMSGSFDTKKFHEAAINWCSDNKEHLYQNWRAGVYKADENRVKTQCFKAAWVSVMLHEGFGFDIFSDEFKLMTLDNIEGKSLQWTLGALLYKSGLAGFDRPHPRAPAKPDLGEAKSGMSMRVLNNDPYGDFNYSPFSFTDGTFYTLVFIVMGIIIFMLIYMHRSIRGGVERIL